ncbi:MAG: hypothetical protein JWO44_1768 [Bacteroidetes bacterium]|nr:hypothetical protein [Bacteroidota bacterium]
MSVLPAADTTLAPSIFQQHELQPRHVKPLIHLTSYDYLVALILFVSFCTFVWLYVSNAKKLNQLVRGFYVNRSGGQLSRDEYSASNRVGFLLSLLFLFTIPLFIGQVIEYTGIDLKMGRIAMYSTIALGLMLTYLVKYITIRLSGFIFKVGKEALDYSTAMLIFVNILGLFMLPVVTCLEFVKQVNPLVFIYTGVFFLAGFLCIRLLRGIVIGFSSNRVSKFYLFLYLCTLEIVPFVILVKLFMRYIA